MHVNHLRFHLVARRRHIRSVLFAEEMAASGADVSVESRRDRGVLLSAPHNCNKTKIKVK